jgi:glutamyl-Q tRNA(Asp) synthetase
MVPDDDIMFQSRRYAAYEDTWQKLLDSDLAFFCACSRSDIPAGLPYPGTCREGIGPGRTARSIRLRISDEPICVLDRVQGEMKERLDQTCGDFVIRRADQQPAYQLAVVVDDAMQGVTEVVRGADLIDSTARQVYLQRVLGLPEPSYMHLPVALGENGLKLSKRFQSDPIAELPPERAIARVLKFLGHSPPPDMSVAGIWKWAVQNWNPDRIPATANALPRPD